MDPRASNGVFGAGIRVARPLSDWVRELGGELDAELGARIARRVTAPRHAERPDDVALVTSPRHLPDLAVAVAAGSILLCDAALATRCPAGRRWLHAHPLWVVTRLVSPPEGSEESVTPSRAPSARIDDGAEIHPTVDVKAGAVILAGASIGPRSIIGENAVVYGRVCVGAGVRIGPLSVIGRPGFGWTTSPRGEVVRVPQLGGVLVEDDVELGALVTVDAGTLGPTIVRRGAKLDAHVHVAHNVEIGAGTFVAAQSGFAGSAVIGNGVLIGGQVGVTDHARVGDGARLGAKSGVIGDVPPGATVAGFPAIPRIEWLRAWAQVLASTARKRRQR